VHPTFLPKTHPLASVNGVYNGLWLHGDFVGDVMFSGRGAGSDPTASAVVGDLIDVARNMAIDGPGSALPYDPDMPTEPINTLRSRYYIRIRTLDRPLVLGKIATAMGQRGVSIAAMEMKTIVPHEEGEIVFLTDYATESDFREAVAALTAEVGVSKVHATIRVED
jgi:homoserine dehydrogenase